MDKKARLGLHHKTQEAKPVAYPTDVPYPFVVRHYEVGVPIECDVRGCDFWCLAQEAFLAHEQSHGEQFADADEGGK